MQNHALAVFLSILVENRARQLNTARQPEITRELDTDLTCALIVQRAPLSSALTRDFRSVILASVIEEIASVTCVRQPRASQPVGGR